MDYLTFAILLVVLGLVLLECELLLPTGGVLFVGSVVSIIAGIYLAFYHGGFTTGLLTMAGTFVALPFALVAMVYLAPHSPMARLLQRPPSKDDTVAAMPQLQVQEKLHGRYGKAVSDLRPAGVVEFDGKRVDVMSEGTLIPAGSWVKCIDAKPGRVIVRAIAAPDLRDLEDDNFTA